MSDEQMSDEEMAQNEHTDAESAAATSALESDELVDARFQVTVIPQENVSAHFHVTPKDPKNAILSVTISFVAQKDGMVEHSFAGSSVQETSDPRPGQGASGDAGVDVAVFAGSEHEGDLYAILAGTVRTEEESGNFFFSRQFHI